MRILKSTLILIIILFSTSAFSVTYYVDFLDGVNTNSGLTTATPFKHCPGDDEASDITKTTILKAGDIVIFRGGVEYNGEIDGESKLV